MYEDALSLRGRKPLHAQASWGQASGHSECFSSSDEYFDSAETSVCWRNLQSARLSWEKEKNQEKGVTEDIPKIFTIKPLVLICLLKVKMEKTFLSQENCQMLF